LDELEKNDRLENNKNNHNIKKDIKDKLEQLQKRKDKYKKLEDKINEAHKKGETQISTTDEDARAM